MPAHINALRTVVLAILLMQVIIVAPTHAVDMTNVAFAQIANGTTSIPVGHAEFCKRHPDECRPNIDPVNTVTLTLELWQQLLSLNTYVNQTVVSVSDEDLYQVSEFWTYPNGYGDCEDFVLEKRRLLIEAGWPASTLLIAVVKQENGEGHAVLMARTDHGDFILDNQVGAVEVWNKTPYLFLKRQSQADAGKWVDMIDMRTTVVTTAGIQ